MTAIEAAEKIEKKEAFDYLSSSTAGYLKDKRHLTAKLEAIEKKLEILGKITEDNVLEMVELTEYGIQPIGFKDLK